MEEDGEDSVDLVDGKMDLVIVCGVDFDDDVLNDPRVYSHLKSCHFNCLSTTSVINCSNSCCLSCCLSCELPEFVANNCRFTSSHVCKIASKGIKNQTIFTLDSFHEIEHQ